MRVKPKNWAFEQGKFHIKSDHNREEHRQTGKERSKKHSRAETEPEAKRQARQRPFPKARACTRAEKIRLWPTGWYRSLAAWAPWPKRLGGKPTQGAVSLLASGTCPERPRDTACGASSGCGLQWGCATSVSGHGEGVPNPGLGR